MKEQTIFLVIISIVVVIILWLLYAHTHPRNRELEHIDFSVQSMGRGTPCLEPVSYIWKDGIKWTGKPGINLYFVTQDYMATRGHIDIVKQASDEARFK